VSVAKPLHSDNKSTNSFSRRWIALFDAIAGSTSDFNSSRFFIPYTHTRIYLNASNRVTALVLFLHPPLFPLPFSFLRNKKRKKIHRGLTRISGFHCFLLCLEKGLAGQDESTAYVGPKSSSHNSRRRASSASLTQHHSIFITKQEQYQCTKTKLLLSKQSRSSDQLQVALNF
jgi:hypothetical protein